jgi:hypothetical protein
MPDACARLFIWPFTTRPSVTEEGRLYVVPLTVMAGPPGARVCDAMTSGVAEAAMAVKVCDPMVRGTAAATSRKVVGFPSINTVFPDVAKEYVVPETSIAVPPALKT